MPSGTPRPGKVVLTTCGLALALLVGGCGGSGPRPSTRSTFVEFSPEQKLAIQNQKASEYRIQEGDILRIAFTYEQNLSQDGVLVLHDGSISLVGVDRVVVAGLTMTQADSVITKAYAKEYREPDLSVLMFKSKGQQVYVLGEVRNPGFYDVPTEGLGIVGAIAMAGGFNENAAADGTALVRITPEGYLCQEVNLGDIGDVSSFELATVQLQAYDVVYVPRSRQGDFMAFSRSVLAGVVNITRIAADIRYLTGGSQRF